MVTQTDDTIDDALTNKETLEADEVREDPSKSHYNCIVRDKNEFGDIVQAIIHDPHSDTWAFATRQDERVQEPNGDIKLAPFKIHSSGQIKVTSAEQISEVDGLGAGGWFDERPEQVQEHLEKTLKGETNVEVRRISRQSVQLLQGNGIGKYEVGFTFA